MAGISISYSDFTKTMAECMRIGYMRAVKSYEPAADYIRETEVTTWLKAMGIELKLFKTLVDRGEINKKRVGKSANSPWFYSKADIAQKLCTANTHRIMVGL